MKTSGLDRALRYFIRQAELFVLCTAGGSFAMSGYIWLINGNGFSFQEILAGIPSAIVMLSMIVLFSISMSSAQYWYSIPISFGCRRKNAFFGNLVMEILFIAQSFVLYAAAVYVLQTDVFPVSISLILALYLVIEGLSKLLGIAAMKWGKAAYIVMTIIIVLISISGGMMAVFVREGDEGVSLAAVLGGYLESSWKWLGLLLGAGVCAAANIAGYRILSHFEVKA